MGYIIFLFAQNGGSVSGIQVEEVFGGAVLLLLLGLLLSGKIRFEREVIARSEIIDIHEETIRKQQETIDALTSRERESLVLLRELREAALRREEVFKELRQ